MSEAASFNLLPDKDRYFQELKATPLLSVPAVMLFLLALGIIAAASLLAIEGEITWPMASLASGIAMYCLFSAAHEGLHHNLSNKRWINEAIGRVAILMLVPGAPFEVARWIHSQHHRFTSCANDPDNFMHHGKWPVLVFRWMNFDIYYMIFFLRHGGDQKKRHGRALIISVVVFLTIIASLIWTGYGRELLFLWILPSRIGLGLIGFVFVFLPHYPADISAEEDEFQATTMRLGWEWLLTPLLVYQNYHLIHHLYPTVPFYNYHKIWHLKYEELTSHRLAVQKDFGLMPVGRVQS